MTQRKNIVSSKPSILALKNIISKVKDQLSMRNLTIAIRQHCLEEHQTHLKDNYLRFFLKCESRLERNTFSEWNKAIDREIKKILGSQKLFLFLALKTFRISYEKIKSYAKLDESTKIEQKICEELDELKDMQISEEVRVKTKYFFKWCQFISQKNQIKKMKNKQIQDLKKSKTFNQYTSKFGSFIKWKQYVRRIKFIKSKGVQLQNKTRTKKLQEIFIQIKQKIEIISIQKLLELAIVNKLQSLGLKSVFGKLTKNKIQQQAKISKLKKQPNIWLYRFYAYLKKRSNLFMNKSSIQSRQQLETEYKKLCKLMCWKGLKLRVLETKFKISRILLASKMKAFNQFTKQTVFKKQIKRKRKQFMKLHKAILINNFIQAYKSTLEHQNLSKNQENCVIKAQVKSYFNIFKANVYEKKRFKSEDDEKLRQLKLKLQIVHKFSFLNSLRGIKQVRVQLFNRGELLQKKISFNFFLRSQKALQQYKKVKKQTYKFLQTNRKSKLVKFSFIGLKAYKKVKIGEYQTFSSIFNLFDSKIKSQVFSCLKKRNHTFLKIQKLVKASEFLTLKVSFITILNKMLSKKMKIKSFCTRKDTQLKRMLFDMLIKNSEHLNESTLLANQFYKKMIKKEFINNLSQQLQQTVKRKAMLKKIQQGRKKIIYNRFKQKQLKAQSVQQSYSYLGKKVKANRFYYFYNSSKQLFEFRLEEKRKSIKVEKTIVRGYFKRMRSFLKERKHRLLQEQQMSCQYASLINQIQFNLTKKALKMMLRQTQTSLNKRIQLLAKVKKQEFIYLLRLYKSNQEIKSQNKILRFNEILSIMSDKCEIDSKKMRLNKFLNLQRSKNIFFNFRNNVEFDFQQRSSKELQLKNYLTDSRHFQSEKILISKIKKHYQMKQNCMILCNRIASLGLKAFMAGYLDKKAEQLKELAALKHYASNVKRHGMRALKYSINMSLLKENRAKTENYSKILIEKSLDNARKKSKLMQTIERYNMSRVSRVLR